METNGDGSRPGCGPAPPVNREGAVHCARGGRAPPIPTASFRLREALRMRVKGDVRPELLPGALLPGTGPPESGPVRSGPARGNLPFGRHRRSEVAPVRGGSRANPSGRVSGIDRRLHPASCHLRNTEACAQSHRGGFNFEHRGPVAGLEARPPLRSVSGRVSKGLDDQRKKPKFHLRTSELFEDRTDLPPASSGHLIFKL
jgi:hypothetical protein